MIHFDTAFLIDLLRETSRDQPGPAVAFMEAIDPGDVLGMSVHVLCELLVGAELSRKPSLELQAIRRMSSALQITYPDERFAPAYGKLQASLQRDGRLIGTMDLLIATVAILDGAPLVTRNVKDFSRVPGLTVRSY